jgi:lipoprotein-releasing system permease protein
MAFAGDNPPAIHYNHPMFSLPERLLAFRYLRARKREGFVSVISLFSFLGILLGVATLIIVMSVMNGFRAEFQDRILGLGGHINVYGKSGPIVGYQEEADQIRKLEGVTQVIPQVDAQVLISQNGTARGAMLRAMAPADMGSKMGLANKIITGFLPELQSEKILIGVRMAESLRLEVGDRLNLLSPAGNVTPFGTMPRSRSYVVGGIFDVGMYEYDANFIYMPLAPAQAFLNMEGRVNVLEVTTTDANHTSPLVKKISNELGVDRRVQDWQAVNGSYFNALQVERNVMFLILTLIIIVAAFNIISGMIMLVKDKGRDIAILRTMGASRGNILRTFMLTGATIGVAGTLAGLTLGVVFALNIEGIRQLLQSLTGTDLFSAEIYFLTRLPAKIDWSEVVGVTGMSLVLSFLATLYPAWRAARLSPVEALRYE